ncbi:alkyl hydroperoxide reductase [Candidatus Carsonella ruddii CS isolate Thao2000]|uniref:Alkyl hydroperoxide reductase C n=1 Tax=Candidatus Carsonella ruddii CS isolate Thao2000 TaxID=1202537 RepID=J7GWG3_CARRU|nr:redoxin domain-containing protein [Candidatus Carsonella ruddii]AFP83786.1 alkyl hydroperoxide reductase [Candidatus Carsonella ruddii CS isolate Thao2000]
MLNTKIKPFNTISYFNKKFYNINLNDLKNKWNIFFFFPYSFTFICPTELKDISNYNLKFKEKNCNLFAISTDSHYTHKKWIESELTFINFPFISDFNKLISKNFNIYNKKDGNCERSTFILDKNLNIKYIEILDNNIGRSIHNIYQKLIMMQFTYKNINKLCPFSWNNDNKAIDINL